MNSLQYRVESEMDASTRALIKQLELQESGVSQVSLLQMIQEKHKSSMEPTAVVAAAAPRATTASTVQPTPNKPVVAKTASSHLISAQSVSYNVPTLLSSIALSNDSAPQKIRRRKRPLQTATTAATPSTDATLATASATSIHTPLIPSEDEPPTKVHIQQQNHQDEVQPSKPTYAIRPSVAVLSSRDEEDFAAMLDASLTEEIFDEDPSGASTNTAARGSVVSHSSSSSTTTYERMELSSSGSAASGSLSYIPYSGSDSPAYLSAYSPSASSTAAGSSPYSPVAARMSSSPIYSSTALSSSASSTSSTVVPSASAAPFFLFPCHSRWFSNPHSTRDHFSKLPVTLLTRIMLLLDASTLCALSRCNISLHKDANDWRLWSTMYVRRFTPNTDRTPNVDWKRKYQIQDSKELNEFLQENGLSPSMDHSHPLNSSFRALYRARTSHLLLAPRRRNEFELIDEFHRKHRDVFHRMAATKGGVEAHAPRCSRQHCSYFFYPPDLYICERTGFVHFCGPMSDDGASHASCHMADGPVAGNDEQPLYIPADGEKTGAEAIEEDEEMDNEQLKLALKKKGAATGVTSSSASSSTAAAPSTSLMHSSTVVAAPPSATTARLHSCVYLDPSDTSSTFLAGLLSRYPRLPLRFCPISLVLNEEAVLSRGQMEQDAADENCKVRGGSPEPEEHLGRGSFLVDAFEFGYSAESIDTATNGIWNRNRAQAQAASSMPEEHNPWRPRNSLRNRRRKSSRKAECLRASTVEATNKEYIYCDA